jgi:hypothetical protein
MYYRIDSDRVTQNIYLERESHPRVKMISGSPLPETTTGPFEFNMSVGKDEEGSETEPLMFAFIPTPCVMHKSFLETLRTAGVDNIQAFPAVLHETRNGRKWTDYVAANIVGLVSCANVAQSKATPLADVYYFHNLVIDPSKTGDLLLFRLAESQTTIIVHEKVAEAIKAGDFEGVVLEPLSEAPAGA